MRQDANLIVRKDQYIEGSFTLTQFIGFSLLNILFAYLTRQFSFFTSIYSLTTFALGMYFLLFDKNPDRVIYVCSYIVGAELIWRSAGNNIFYEFAKYATIILLAMSLIKFNLLIHANKWPILYFALLVPSISLMPEFDRMSLASWLSGPLLLTIAYMVFSQITITYNQIKKILIMIIAPSIGLAFLALMNTLTTESILFRTQSNFITSGGSFPVQVSLQLAFGAVSSFYFAVNEKKSKFLFLIMILVAIWLISQSLFTFSRSGLYAAVATILVLLFHTFIKRRNIKRFSLYLIGIGFILVFVIFPFLDEYTSGILSLRYSELGTSGRDVLARVDIQTFKDHPWFGVGLGQSSKYHLMAGYYGSAHTEYSRMLAEHGVFGLLSLAIMVGLAMKGFFRKTKSEDNGFNSLIIVWALVYMASISLRTASPGFAFGLGAVTLINKHNSVTGGNKNQQAERDVNEQ